MFEKKKKPYSEKLNCRYRVVTFIAMVIMISALHADVKIAHVFGSNAIIQQGRSVPVWGYGTPGEKVKVTISGVDGCKLSQAKSAVADARGKWVVTFDPLKAGAKFHLHAQGEKSKDASYNIQAGDVWFYIGKYRFRYSRLLPAKVAKNWDKENKDLAAGLRIYGTNTKSTVRQLRENGSWKGPAVYNIFGFSPGIADHFAIELFRSRKIPVGIIHVSSIYGHWIDEYLPAEAFVRDPVLGKTADAKKLAYRVGGTDECKKLNAKRIAYMEKYLKDAVKLNAANQTVPHPDFPPIPAQAATKTALMYNGAIAPLLPLAVKGVIFNDPNGPRPFDADKHDRKLQLLVKSCRKWFNDPLLPFFIIQAPARSNQNTVRSNTRFANQQKLGQNDKNVIVVPTGDIEVYRAAGDLFLKTIPAKGHRLFLLADRKVYGRKSAGNQMPEITGVKRENDKLKISFSMPMQTVDGQAPDGFALKSKGENIYRPAKAEIKNNSIILSAPGVTAPENANYCYVNKAIKNKPNVCGKNNMPVPAFATELLDRNGAE